MASPETISRNHPLSQEEEWADRVQDLHDQYDLEYLNSQDPSENGPSNREIQSEVVESQAREALGLIHGPIDSYVSQAIGELDGEDAANAEIEQAGAKFDKRNQKIDKKIAKRNEKAEKLRENGKMSLKKSRSHEWKMLGLEHQKRINEQQREQANKEINEKHGVDNTAELAGQTKGYKTLKDEVRGIREEVARRRELEAKLSDPSIDPELRSLIDQEVQSWNGETVEVFENRRMSEAEQKHNQWNKNYGNDEKFKDATSQIEQRFEITEKARSSKDPAERQKNLLEMSKWTETTKEFKQRLLGNNVDEFNDWVKEHAAWDIKEASENVDEKLKPLVKQFGELIDELNQELENADKLDEQIARAKTDDEKKKLESEDAANNEKVTDLKKQLNNLHEKIEAARKAELKKANADLAKKMRMAEL